MRMPKPSVYIVRLCLRKTLLVGFGLGVMDHGCTRLVFLNIAKHMRKTDKWICYDFRVEK